MMRGMIGTFVWALMAAVVGIGLFFVKHEVKEQEARLASLNQEIRRNQEAIHVLKAEWAYLNDPARLRQLSERHLGMKPMSPSQVASIGTLPREQGSTHAVAATPAQPPAVAKAEPARPAPAVAKAEPAKPAPSRLAAAPAQPKAALPQKAAAPAPARLAASPMPVPQPTPPAAGPQAPRRTIVIQSPALATTDLNSSGEPR